MKNKHKGTITDYAEAVNHLLERYTTDAVIAKDDEETISYKQYSLAPWDFSKSYET